MVSLANLYSVFHILYKKGRLIPTAKRGKETKEVKLKQVQYIVLVVISLPYFFFSLRRWDQSTVFCIVSFDFT